MNTRITLLPSPADNKKAGSVTSGFLLKISKQPPLEPSHQVLHLGALNKPYAHSHKQCTQVLKTKKPIEEEEEKKGTE